MLSDFYETPFQSFHNLSNCSVNRGHSYIFVKNRPSMQTGRLAQLVERRTCEHNVPVSTGVGSSPRLAN